ncbi:MAG: mobile mystery protein B [Bacteroidetes bacterium]|nr:mobile mystery protein B [Bacteroidota bacterium]
MGLNLDYDDGQTPIDEEEKDGLLISAIATRGELDEFEQQNIEEAVEWVIGKTFKPERVFSEQFVCNLHKRMFNDVWKWAGKYRLTNKNLGINYWEIPTALRQLCDDALFWIQNQTFGPDEIAIRFKHRVVSIHCFPNGNGRHSRLMADVIAQSVFKQPFFSWGMNTGLDSKSARSIYLLALKEADAGDFRKLVEFART